MEPSLDSFCREEDLALLGDDTLAHFSPSSPNEPISWTQA